ncbi:uncharacterized protein HMPREF1541_02871 [Cyphellophora europaea CBS 101466]|uniref:Uncharacterized protein n=1 Tax=Cyphellophora europaea (strain CBS 101466) TaxID=1220924 RepID=W2S4U4_CYPE1|nr:uncharacterized protein HMPREF1541_02871 [Cyphellophora europaea CBS 101466]ETN43712.1 hypothetical protein HMPREF1541_02871 [Cyphellophora europaea CBS 101466]
MSAIFHHKPATSEDTPLRSVVGIVDKLPGPFTTDASRPTPCEGLAYYLCPSKGHDTVQAPVHNDDSVISSLRFTFFEGRVANGVVSPTQRQVAWGHGSISVPLANTLFINGRKSTLIETFWARTASQLSPTKTSDIIELAIPMYRCPGNSIINSIPLQRMTSPREVRSAMGNILGEIEIAGVTVPASKELEDVVMKTPLQTQPDGGRSPVFASIASPNRQRSGDFPGLYHLWSGTGLHRVTGGGGGWGQKQGLLSLEPFHALSTHVPTPGASTAPVDAHEGSLPPVFQREADLVCPGDRVTFWRTNTDLEIQENGSFLRSYQKSGWTSKDGRPRILMGLIHPQEEVPGASAGQSSNDAPQVKIMRNCFGLLSEHAFALQFSGKRQVLLRNNEEQPAALRSEPAEIEEFTSQSNFEVPNAYFSTAVDGSGRKAKRETADSSSSRPARSKARKEAPQGRGSIAEKTEQSHEAPMGKNDMTRSTVVRKILIDTAVPTSGTTASSTASTKSNLEDRAQADRKLKSHWRRPRNLVRKMMVGERSDSEQLKMRDSHVKAVTDRIDAGASTDDATKV